MSDSKRNAEIERFILRLLEDRKWHYWADVEKEADDAFIKIGEHSLPIDQCMNHLVAAGQIEINWEFDVAGWVGIRRTDKQTAKRELQLELF